jgi:hypothetical protein
VASTAKQAFNGSIMAITVLRSLVAVSRMLRHASSVGADLPPDGSVVVDAPDARLAEAAVGLDGGDFKPVAELLSWSRETAWWETRDRYAGWLAARPAPSWLDAWRDADPDNPDGALVRAEIAVRQAFADPAPARRAAALRDTAPAVRAAAQATPSDPVPWRIAITRARGMGAPRPVFDALWEQAAARSPHHFGCHVSALRYLCATVPGPSREGLDFARRAAARVLPGSLVAGLPLMAAYEYLLSGGRDADAYTDAAIARARELSAWHERGDREAAQVRNVLAQMLILRQRWAEALDEFRAIGVNATAFPWSLTGEPRSEFLEMRTGVRVQLASTVRLWTRRGGPYA